MLTSDQFPGWYARALMSGDVFISHENTEFLIYGKLNGTYYTRQCDYFLLDSIIEPLEYLVDDALKPKDRSRFTAICDRSF